MGPVLCLLFTNDFSSHIIDCNLIMYADDVQFIHVFYSDALTDLKGNIEETLPIANSWFSQNSLKINPNKTYFMLIHRRQRRSVGTSFINFDSSVIQPSQTTKTFVIIVHKHLTCGNHTSRRRPGAAMHVFVACPNFLLKN